MAATEEFTVPLPSATVQSDPNENLVAKVTADLRHLVRHIRPLPALALIAMVGLLALNVHGKVEKIWASDPPWLLSILTAATVFLFERTRSKTPQQELIAQACELLRTEIVDDPRTDAELRENFIKAIEHVLLRPPHAQPPEIRAMIQDQLARFLRSLDFRPDAVLKGTGPTPLVAFDSDYGAYASDDLEPNSTPADVFAALDDAIRQYAADHRILPNLALVNRDVNATMSRLNEYWDHRAQSQSFPEEAVILEVIMNDVNHTIDAVIELNSTFRFHDAILGTEQRDLGLGALQAEQKVAIAALTDKVQAFQGAGRSTNEALNRYFDLARAIDLTQEAANADLDSPLLRVAGADAAKALRIFRTLSFHHAFGKQLGETRQVLSYVSAARARLKEYREDVFEPEFNFLSQAASKEAKTHLNQTELALRVFQKDLYDAYVALSVSLDLPGPTDVTTHELATVDPSLSSAMDGATSNGRPNHPASSE